MKSILKLLSFWKPSSYGLLFGLLLSALSLFSLFLLMGQTGSRLSFAVLGGSLLGFSLLRVAGIGRIFLRYFERLQTHNAMFHALKKLRLWFYGELLKKGASGLGFKRSADMLTRLVHDIQTLDALYLRIFIPFALALLSLPLLIVLCASLPFYLGGVICLLFIIIAFILPFLSYKIANFYSENLLKSRAELHIKALDLTSSLREARLFNAEEEMAEKLLSSEGLFYHLQKEKGKKTALIHLCSHTLSRLSLIIFLLYMVFEMKADISPSHLKLMISLIAIFFILTTIFDIISELPRAGLLAGESVKAAERLLELPEENAHLENAQAKETLSLEKADFPKKYDISLQNISFGWEGKAPLFKDLTLHIPQGSKLALLGPSGAGKSSLASLILRVFSPQKGEILIDQTPLATIKEESLRQHISWLSQASHLFDDTLRNNLLLGREDIPEEKLWDALEKAQIAEFVRELPEKLDHWIGENGAKISGGQGRRIALARALLSDAPILILDEPATGLDFETEYAFLETLNHIDEKKTVILITHRLLGIEKIDYIWQIEKGQVEQKLL